MSENAHSHEDQLTPEELISQMSSDELQELLGEIGFEASCEMAGCIQKLVLDLGSLEAAITALAAEDTPMRRAA